MSITWPLLQRRDGLGAVEAFGSRTAYLIEVTYDRARAETAWSELESAGSAFQSRQWLTPWYEILAPRAGARPLFVIVRDRMNGRPLVFFALCVRKRWGLTLVEFPDLGVTDYNAPIWAPDFALDDEQSVALWAAIRKSVPDVDAIYFDKVPTMLYGLPVPFASLAWLKPIETRCWTVRLPSCRADYEAGLIRKDRKEQRRKRRNITEKHGEAVFIEAGSRQEAMCFFETLKTMRAARFDRERRRDILQDRKIADFYRALVLDWRDFVSLAKVQAGGKTIATFLALRHGSKFVLIMHSFAADIEKLSPGIVALDELISHLIRCGVEYCDFTIGNEPYKLQFGVKASAMHRGVSPVTPQGYLFSALFNANQRLHGFLVKTYRNCAGKFRALANS
jgi:CelD/BcsL family acetyltransferase involved in cellulose biosynthesis